MSRKHPVPRGMRRENGLGDLVNFVKAGNLLTGGSQLSAYNTLAFSNNYSLVTLNRIVLTYMFTTNGLFQTALQLPIQDAISRGIEMESNDLDAANIDEVMEFWEDNGVWDSILNAATWGRLYGGGGLLINTNQDPETPIDLKRISRGPLELYDVERWQLDSNFPYTEEFQVDGKTGDFMWLLGKKIHASRFILMKGKRAPSYVRAQLRGWGMSEGERMIRELNLYLKTQDVLYEILDESKVDVYHIEGLANKIMTSEGASKIAMRVQLANELKSYVSALMLDSNEQFEQKTMSFAGLAEVSRENRIGVASALRMPVTKLFGMSASGFSSGEEDLESYNQMVESEIRRPLNGMVKGLLDVTCAYLFGFQPRIRFRWPAMRVLTEAEHQDKLDKETNRALSLFDRGLIESKEVGQMLKKAGVLTIQTKMEEGLVPNPTPPGGGMGGGGFEKTSFQNSEFKEEDHPRAADGKFGTGGGKSKKEAPKVAKDITSEQAAQYRKKGIVPEGWFVHGRAGRQDLDTGNVIQLSKDWDVAEQYAGKKGSQWMLAPKDEESVMDLTDESVRSKIIGKLSSEYSSGKLGNGFPEVRDLIESQGDDDDSVAKVLSDLGESLNPENIVDSAGWHDNQDLVYWLYERFNPGMVQTNDGAVVYDLSKMKTVKV